VVDQVITGRYADGLGSIKVVPQRVDFQPYPHYSMAVWLDEAILLADRGGHECPPSVCHVRHPSPEQPHGYDGHHIWRTLRGIAPETAEVPMEAAAPSRKQLTHERIVETAARALRNGGFAGIGVADIMKQAGLTHGGFYAHFASREALLAEALARERGESPFAALVGRYLADSQLKSCEKGCPIAALGSELPRQSDAVREAGSARVQALIAAVDSTLPPGRPEGTAAVVASQLVGALQLARTLGDNARGRRHLAAARRFLLQQYPSPGPTGR
jgi:TetR/AcrR family transcriptional regulator, transcriptional repressor for nem operon